MSATDKRTFAGPTAIPAAVSMPLRQAFGQPDNTQPGRGEQGQREVRSSSKRISIDLDGRAALRLPEWLCSSWPYRVLSKRISRTQLWRSPTRPQLSTRRNERLPATVRSSISLSDTGPCIRTAGCAIIVSLLFSGISGKCHHSRRCVWKPTNTVYNVSRIGPACHRHTTLHSGSGANRILGSLST